MRQVQIEARVDENVVDGGPKMARSEYHARLRGCKATQTVSDAIGPLKASDVSACFEPSWLRSDDT